MGLTDFLKRNLMYHAKNAIKEGMDERRFTTKMVGYGYKIPTSRKYYRVAKAGEAK